MTSRLSTLFANRWLFVPCALLLTSVSFGVLTVTLAVANHPLGVEPGYDSKAAHFESERQQRETNDRLRWIVTPSVERLDGRLGGVRLHIEDRNANAIDASTVRVECIPVGNADGRSTVDLAEALAGDYAGTFAIRGEGLYEFRVSIKREGDTYTDLFRRNVAAVAR